MVNELDDLPFSYPDVTPSNPAAVARKCRHPRDKRRIFEGGVACGSCGKEIDPERQRQGRRSHRLGGDQERRIERVYGPTKIGERGDPVDHLGARWRWQSKATRALPPLWLGVIDMPTHRDVPKAVADAWNRMTGLYDPRLSVVIRSFVHAGTRTRDWLFIGAEDGIAEFGPVIPFYTGWWVIPGDWWLDHYGPDLEVAA